MKKAEDEIWASVYLKYKNRDRQTNIKRMIYKEINAGREKERERGRKIKLKLVKVVTTFS